MGKKITKIALAAGFMFALTFTFSCSSDDDSNSYDKGNNIANYKTKQIGDQVWMAENLNYNVAGSKCYNNDPANCSKYGRLYNWTTAMALPDSCKSNKCDFIASAKRNSICPSGWHIPNEDEWDELIDFLGGSNSAGNKLKTTSGWDRDGNGKDTYGFSALPGGFGESNGDFDEIGGYGYWWSANEISEYGAYYLHMDYDGDGTYWSNNYKSNLFSIRCLQDRNLRIFTN